MSTANSDSTRPASLDRRIRETEDRLARRRETVGFRAASLGRNLREKLSSPLAVLVAAGAGFAIGHFSRCNTAQTQADGDSGTPRQSVFATLLEAFTLASTVIAMLPVLRQEPADETRAADQTR